MVADGKRTKALYNRMLQLVQRLESNHNRVSINDGGRSDDDVARVDANEIREAEEMEISVNEIGGKETVRNGDYHLCEALTQRCGTDGKEIVCRGGHHLDEALTYRSGSGRKEELKVGAQPKEGGALICRGEALGSFKRPPLIRKPKSDRLLVEVGCILVGSKKQKRALDERHSNLAENGVV
ncbi:unnamed protein product [Linum trigynum]|uniref:Uncharacterized protein n=1 Tax=Linum trigynum TaxID=586398 RepID=A0AAV2DJD8_9ROSI